MRIVDAASIGAALPVVPAMGVVCVLEWRGTAMCR